MVFQKNENGALNQSDLSGDGQTEVMNFRDIYKRTSTRLGEGWDVGSEGREVLRRIASTL